MSRCHGSKISGSQHNRVPANMVGKNEKKKSGNKTGRRANTSTK